MHDTMLEMDKLKIIQGNISAQFIKFGASIEHHSSRLSDLEPLVYRLKESKADKKTFQNRIGQCERDYQRMLEELEGIRIDNRATDKYLQVYQPISTVTEIDRMFRAVFPRRRH